MTALDDREREERKYMHDVATPLGVAVFLVDAVLEDLQSQGVSQDSLAQLNKIRDALNKVTAMLHQRREVLIKRGGTGA